MPVITHLVARQNFEISSGGGGGGITATAIGLIVGIGIIPALILIYVVSWLFWCYPYNRTCCCTRRKKRQPDPEITEPHSGAISSGETVYEKRMDLPQRPASNRRSESGSSYGAPAPARLSKNNPRLSMQTVDSNYTGRITHEPKPFV